MRGAVAVTRHPRACDGTNTGAAGLFLTTLRRAAPSPLAASGTDIGCGERGRTLLPPVVCLQPAARERTAVRRKDHLAFAAKELDSLNGNSFIGAISASSSAGGFRSGMERSCQPIISALTRC